MRSRLILMLALALTVSAVGVAWATDSTGQDFSTLKMKVSPKKLSKKKFKPAKLFVDTSTLSNSNPGTPTSPGSQPIPTTDVKLKFDKDIKFTSKGLAQCKKNLQNTTTQQALAACKKAKVGGGKATACLGNPCTPLNFTVTAFNGKPKGKKPTIVLHSASPGLPTTVLVGTLNPKTNVLNVPVPALPAVITDFQTTVKRAYKSKGKTRNYVTARCSHKKLTLKGTFTYASSSEPKDHPTASSKCKA